MLRVEWSIFWVPEKPKMFLPRNTRNVRKRQIQRGTISAYRCGRSDQWCRSSYMT